MKNCMGAAHRLIKSWMYRGSMLVLITCLALSACVVINVPASPPASPSPITKEISMTSIIKSILSDPGKYAGSEVEIVGYYRGWNLLAEAGGKSPVTRSDWVVKDSSAAIYVQAKGTNGLNLSPGSLENTNKIIRVTGWVRLTADNQPYIEPRQVELLGEDAAMNKTPLPLPVELKENPYQPQSGDESLLRAPAYFDSVELKSKSAGSAVLLFKGSLPTPCHKLRIEFSSSGNQLLFNAYSLISADVICIQVIQPFEIELEVQNLGVGEYIVKVNGQEMLRF